LNGFDASRRFAEAKPRVESETSLRHNGEAGPAAGDCCPAGLTGAARRHAGARRIPAAGAYFACKYIPLGRFWAAL
jgi:hypothetical protein